MIKAITVHSKCQLAFMSGEHAWATCIHQWTMLQCKWRVPSFSYISCTSLLLLLTLFAYLRILRHRRVIWHTICFYTVVMGRGLPVISIHSVLLCSWRYCHQLLQCFDMPWQNIDTLQTCQIEFDIPNPRQSARTHRFELELGGHHPAGPCTCMPWFS